MQIKNTTTSTSADIYGFGETYGRSDYQRAWYWKFAAARSSCPIPGKIVKVNFKASLSNVTFQIAPRLPPNFFAGWWLRAAKKAQTLKKVKKLLPRGNITSEIVSQPFKFHYTFFTIWTMSSSSRRWSLPTFCGRCLADEPHTKAYLNCLIIALCSLLQKSSTVQRLCHNTTGSV